MRVHRKTHPALKHGGYSTTTLLPGEDPASFKKLHQALIAELAPSGELEKDIVAAMARFVWRRKNLLTFRLAEFSRKRLSEIRFKCIPQPDYLMTLDEDEPDPAEVARGEEAATDQARSELGDMYELAEIGEIATIDQLMKELAVEERLDAMIDKCLKRLLFVRGLKSISSSSSSAPLPLIQGPSKAA
jgi:hypothetical protein